ncbi:UNVERIFIED_CONTAM: phage tail spike protein, partial [Kocuria sp. CPCC 205274]
LGGSKGSLLDLWGGEFQFDNYDIKLRAQRGKVADTIIAYGRNLEEFEDETDITDVFTSIRPFMKYTDEKTKQEKYIFASPEIIDHANASKFPNKKVFVYDMSSEFDMSAGKLPTPANIATKATAYMKANDFGVPKTTMKLSYVDLSKTLDYTQYKALEEVNLCDMIPIHYEKLGVTGNAKIT